MDGATRIREDLGAMNKLVIALALVTLAGCSQRPPEPTQAQKDESNRKFEEWTVKEGSGKKWQP